MKEQPFQQSHATIVRFDLYGDSSSDNMTKNSTFHIARDLMAH